MDSRTAVAEEGARAALEILERQAVRHNAVAAGADDAFLRTIKHTGGTVTLHDFDCDVGTTQQSLALAEALVLQALSSTATSSAVSGTPSAESVGVAQIFDPSLRASLMRLITEIAQPNVGLLEPDAVKARVRRLLIAQDRAALLAQQRAEELLTSAALYECAVATRAAADTASCRAYAAGASGAVFEQESARSDELAAAAAACTLTCTETLDRLSQVLAPLPPARFDSEQWASAAADAYVLVKLPLRSALGKLPADPASFSASAEDDTSFGLSLQLGSVPAAVCSDSIFDARPAAQSLGPGATGTPAMASSGLFAVIEECLSPPDVNSGAHAEPAYLCVPAPSPERELAILAATHGLRYFHTGRRPGETIAALPTDADDALPPDASNADVAWSWASFQAQGQGETGATARESPPFGLLNDRVSSPFQLNGRVPGLRIAAIATDSPSAHAGLLRCNDVILSMGRSVERASWGSLPAPLQSRALDLPAAGLEASDSSQQQHPWVRAGFASAVSEVALDEGAEGYVLIARPSLLVTVEAVLRGLSVQQALTTPWTTGAANLPVATVAPFSSSQARSSESLWQSAVERMRAHSVDPLVHGNNTVALCGAAAVPGAAFAMGCEEGSFRDITDGAGVSRGYIPTGSLAVDPAIADALRHYPTAAQQAARAAAISAVSDIDMGRATTSSVILKGGKFSRKSLLRPPPSQDHCGPAGRDESATTPAPPVTADKPATHVQRFVKKGKASGPAVAGALKASGNGRRVGPPVTPHVPDSDKLSYSSVPPSLCNTDGSVSRYPVSREDILIAALRLECRYQRLTQGSSNTPGTQQPPGGSNFPVAVLPALPAPVELKEVFDEDASHHASLAAAAMDVDVAPSVIPAPSLISGPPPSLESSDDTAVMASVTELTAVPSIAVTTIDFDAKSPAHGEAVSTNSEQTTAIIAGTVVPLDTGATSGDSASANATQAAELSVAPSPTNSEPPAVGMRVTFRMLTAAALRRICEAIGISHLGDKFVLATRFRQLIRGMGDIFRKEVGTVEICLADRTKSASDASPSPPFTSDGELAEQAQRVPLLSAAQSSSSILLALLPPENAALESAILQAYYRYPEIVAMVRKGPKRVVTAASAAPLSTADAAFSASAASAAASIAHDGTSPRSAAVAPSSFASMSDDISARRARSRKPSARLVNASSDDLSDELSSLSSAIAGVKKPSDGRTMRKDGLPKKPRLIQQLLHTAGASAPSGAAAGASSMLANLPAGTAAADSRITAADEPVPAPTALSAAAPSTASADLSCPVPPAVAGANDTASLEASSAAASTGHLSPEAPIAVNPPPVASSVTVSAVSDDAGVAEKPAVAVQSGSLPLNQPSIDISVPVASTASTADGATVTVATARPDSSPQVPVIVSASPMVPIPAPPRQPLRPYKKTKGKHGPGKKQFRVPTAAVTAPAHSVLGFLSDPAEPSVLDTLSAAAAAVTPGLDAVFFAPSDAKCRSEPTGALSVGSRSGPGKGKCYETDSATAIDEAGVSSDCVPTVWRYAAYAPPQPVDGISSHTHIDSGISTFSAQVSSASFASLQTVDLAVLHRPFTAKRRRNGAAWFSTAGGDFGVANHSSVDFSLLAPTLPPVLTPSPACELIARLCACTFVVHASSEARAQRMLVMIPLFACDLLHSKRTFYFPHFAVQVSARVPDARPVVARAIADLAFSRGGGGDAFSIAPLHRAILSSPSAMPIENAPSTVYFLRTSAIDSLLTTTKQALALLSGDMRRFPLQVFGLWKALSFLRRTLICLLVRYA
jgi:hypothetical protein